VAHSHDIGMVGEARMAVPDGTTFTPDGHGGYALMQGKEVLADHLRFDSHGQFTPDSLKALGAHGIHASHTVDVFNTHAEGQVTPQQYLANHHELNAHHVSRELWYDNDTPKPVFDKNELKLWWGGAHNTGIDADGKYTFSVEHMLKGGSYHNGLSAHAKELYEGHHLKMLLSVSHDSQATPIEVPIDADGNVHIDPTTEPGKHLFSTVNGKAHFLGRFAEVAQMTGADTHGTEHVKILATYEGKGLDHLKDTITTHHAVPHNILTGPSSHKVPFVWDPPLPIPLFYRTPLEPMTGLRPPVPLTSPIVAPKPGVPEAVPVPASYPYSYAERVKKYYTDLSSYRNSPASLQKLEQRIKGDKQMSEKYKKVFDRLDLLNRFDKLTDAEKQPFVADYEYYKGRYGEITMEAFVDKERDRMRRQIENIAIEEAKVGEKPFDESFYRESPLVKGIDGAKEVVVCLDDPIGDAVLTVPALDVLSKYLAQNKEQKKLILMTKHPALFASLADQYPGLSIVSPADAPAYFAANPAEKPFVINAHKGFDQYDMLGLKPDEANDPSHVLSVDWGSWQEEEYPEAPGRRVRYNKIPARIARNFEVMLGQKVYDNINGVKNYIERGKNFPQESADIRSKYQIAPDEKVIVISPGSSVTPKEYQPGKWEAVVKGIARKLPNAHVLLLEDPDPKRRARYGAMADRLSQEGIKISRADEGMDKMNTVMSMADYVLTPDTGLGHYAGALGKPAVMLFLSDASLWSTPGALPVRHPVANQIQFSGKGVYGPAWQSGGYGSQKAGTPDEYFVRDGTLLVGASDIDPERIIEKIN